MIIYAQVKGHTQSEVVVKGQTFGDLYNFFFGGEGLESKESSLGLHHPVLSTKATTLQSQVV